MNKYLVLRRLAGSDLGWFADARRQGKAKGRQRGINLNADILAYVLDGLPADTSLVVRTVRYSDGQTQIRSIKKQQKNWRLVGDMVAGRGFKNIDEGDFFWFILDTTQDTLLLIWDVLIRRVHPALHNAIASHFGPRLRASMGAWQLDDAEANRFMTMLDLELRELVPHVIEGSRQKWAPEKIVSEEFPDFPTLSRDLPVKRGRSTLRPRARLLRAIGEDLISNEIVALVELIKNSYDADAHIVRISFSPEVELGRGTIEVQDDGHGMSLDTLQSAWMEPSTLIKSRNRISPGGRRVTGEKGLGRFAVARLAQQLRVESVTARSGRMVVAEFNWDDFGGEEAFLDEVACEWQELAVPDATPAGTRLLLSGVKDEWNFESFRRLRGELSRLIMRPSDRDPFNVILDLPPEYVELAGLITPPPVLSRPHYFFSGEVTKDGFLVGELQVGETRHHTKERLLIDRGRVPNCGPFAFELKAWDRDRDELGRLATALHSTVRDLQRDLNEAAGVSIYRDGFRVLPYGSASNDWLRLDLRRVQNPTMKLSSNQVVGEIYVTADGNPELRDQTNREGIVDSFAFDDLKASIIEILGFIETARYGQRRKSSKLEKQGSLFGELSLGSVRTAFSQKYPGDQEFLEYLDEKEREVRHSVEQIQAVIVRYRRLATLGQLVDVVLHDGRTPLSAISSQCLLGSRELKKAEALAAAQTKLQARLDTIMIQADVLSTLFKRISPFGGRKRGQRKECKIEELVADSVALLHDRVEDLGVAVHISDTRTTIKADTSEIQQVFINLLQNSLYWLAKVPQEQRQVVVQVMRRDGEIEILFSDSGPGVPDEFRSLIFDPYFSARPDGVGLGLTIAGEIVSEYDGSLELVEPGLLSGANFRIMLRVHP